MKVGILTLSVAVNYGGILQAYALLTSLRKEGYDAWLIDRKRPPISSYQYVKRLIKKTILSLFGRGQYEVLSESRKKRKEKEIGYFTSQFINKYILPKTEACYSSQDMKNKLNFDAYVVGSDQVWRPKYTWNIYDYFLDFLEGSNAKRISYAASFGTDKWEYSLTETEKCKILLENFSGISVRESDAVRMCQEYFHVKAEHVLDPTLLLTKNEYIENLSLLNIEKSSGNLMTYILDMSQDKRNIIDDFSKQRGLDPFDLDFNDKWGEQSKVALPVEKWLRGFLDAEFVITDSFHGTVFSIIFNKPFISLGNQNRGMSRFTSLLSLLGLENRLITSLDLLNTIDAFDIDWVKVNQILDRERANSINFLKNTLKK